jgi:imidazoleglycerol phosphate synthase glutamine amidotransferase subunit HisH
MRSSWIGKFNEAKHAMNKTTMGDIMSYLSQERLFGIILGEKIIPNESNRIDLKPIVNLIAERGVMRNSYYQHFFSL